MVAIRKEKTAKDVEDVGLDDEDKLLLDSPKKDDETGKKGDASAGKGKRPSSSRSGPPTDLHADVTPCSSPKSSASKGSAANDSILAIWHSIQENQKKQNDSIESLSNRIHTIENYDYDEEGDYDEYIMTRKINKRKFVKQTLSFLLKSRKK